MKKIIPALLLCLFALQSCRDKETVYIETPVVSQPEKNEAKTPRNNRTEDTEVPNSVNDQQDTNDKNELSINCESDQCNESIGYVKYKNTVCQATQIGENELLVSGICLDPRNLGGVRCSELLFYNQSNETNCLKVSKKIGYYKIKTRDLLGSNSLKIGVASVGNEINEVRFTNKNTDQINESLTDCDLEFNSYNNLDANGYNSELFYSLNCKSDFLFSNQELVAVKVGKDEYGFRYFNLSCEYKECEKKTLSRKDKILDRYFKETKVGMRSYENSQKDMELSLITYDKEQYFIKDNKLKIIRDIKCIKISDFGHFRQIFLEIPFKINERNIITFKENKLETHYNNYFINYLYQNHPLVKHVIRGNLIKPDSNQIINQVRYEDQILDSLNWTDKYINIFTIRNHIDKFKTYVTSENIVKYDNFVDDFLNKDLDHYQVKTVPNCSAL